MKNELWDQFKSHISSMLSVNPLVIDSIAVDEILKLSCTGLANKSIAKNLDMDETYIHDVIVEYFNFAGWRDDLDVNPWFIYNRSGDNFDRFYETISSVSPLVGYIIANICFKMCQRYQIIRKDIDNYYGETS